MFDGLKELQNSLVDSGVIDIKFCFNEDVAEYDLSTVKCSLIRILKCHVMTKYKKLEKLDDRYLAL